MNKEALILDNSNILDVFLSSALIGSGGFAATRLLKDTLRAMRHTAERGEDENSLTIDLPKEIAPQQPIHKTGEDDMWKVLAVLGGLPAGFMGTKMLYDKYKKNQQDEELNLANERYLDALKNYKIGTDKTPTPAVDALCEKIAEMVNKNANVFSDISDGLAQLNPFSSPSPDRLARQQLTNQKNREVLLNTIRNLPIIRELFEFGKGGAILTALGASGLTYAAMNRARKNRTEAERKSRFPSTVEINYN